MIINKKEAIYASYTASALAGALLEAIGKTPRGEEKRHWGGPCIVKEMRANCRKWAIDALNTSPDHPEFLGKVQWGKMMLRTGGLGDEKWNAPRRKAEAQILWAVRDLYKESKKYRALAVALGATSFDINLIGFTGPTRFQLVDKAIEILESNGWVPINGARNADVRFIYE